MSAENNTTDDLNSQTVSPLYTTKDLAVILQVDRETVRRYIREGRIKALPLAVLGVRPNYRITQEALDEFIKGGQK